MEWRALTLHLRSPSVRTVLLHQMTPYIVLTEAKVDGHN